MKLSKEDYMVLLERTATDLAVKLNAMRHYHYVHEYRECMKDIDNSMRKILSIRRELGTEIELPFTE